MSARHLVQHEAPAGTAAHLASRFYVITAITNTRRFRTRYELYDDFADYCRASGATLVTVECQLHKRKWAVTRPDHPFHYQLYTQAEIWHKENMLAYAISRLPTDWLYVAWVDADVTFVRPDWVNETVQMLQHHPIVQMFTEAQDLGPNYELMSVHESFAKSYAMQRPRPKHFEPYYGVAPGTPGMPYMWHPGYAWAARREAIDALGGLIDFAVLGAADNHFANCLIGQGEHSIHPDAHPNYRKWVMQYQDRAEKYIRRNVGVVDGTLIHYWHGKKLDRQYWNRWRILIDNQFDPEADLKRDSQGLWQLVDTGTERSRKLRDGIRSYFQSRSEDSIDV